jgi:replicative DNA helicase
MSKLQDKKAILHVIAGLMDKPERLNHKEYPLDIEDFPELFHKIVFGSIKNLLEQKAENVNYVEIDGYLSNYSAQYKTFNDNTGLDYLMKAEEIGESDNYEMHYTRVKKFSFLRECKKVGIDVTDIYDEKVVDLKEEKEQNDRFNDMSLGDMVKHIELKIINIRDSFLRDQSLNGGHMSENIREIMEEKRGVPSYGAPMISNLLNSIFRGSRAKKLILKHGNTGSGKSRLGMANIAVKCIPEIYDSKQGKWIKTGAIGKGLMISSELDEEEIKIPFLCYIAEVEEDRIHEALVTPEEQLRLDRAIDILEESDLWFEELNDFDIDDIDSIVVKYINKHDIGFCEFDYIHSSLKLLTSLSEKGVKNLREDQVLLLMGIALKNICNKYNIHIESSTQLNDNQNINNNRDQSWIRGSKALADKIDGGYIILDIREKDQKVIDEIYASGAVSTFGKMPNISLNVYKNRGGRHKRVSVYGHFDKGTLRFEDMFVVNYDGELVEKIHPKKLLMSDPNQTVSDILPTSFDF